MKLIDKSALVAEIKRRKETWQHQDQQYVAGGRDVCDYLLGFLDTLEVKEVDLKAEIERLIKSYSPIWSSEGKYRIEAYKEILDIINSNCLEISRSGNSRIRENRELERIINKACDWLADNYSKYIITNGLATIFSATIDFDIIRMIEDLKKAIEE